MIDGIPVMSLAAAAIIGWFLCMTNKRVFIAWKFVAPVAMIYLAGYVFFALIGPGSRMVLWSGIQMDRVALTLSLLPVLAWPMELKFLRAFARDRGDRDMRVT